MVSLGGPWAHEVAVALMAARAAARFALSEQQNLSHWRKTDGTYVTSGDLAVEKLLLSLIRQSFPQDALLSEEMGQQGNGTRRWILDPIDGTDSYFARGRRWGTHIALESHGQIVLGIVTRPTENEMWWALRGVGSYLSPITGPWKARKLEIPLGADLGPSRLSGELYPESGFPDVVRRQERWVEPAVFSAGALCRGQIDGYLDDGGKVWDIAPVTILVTEAGGLFEDPHGSQSNSAGWAIFSNHKSRAVLRDLVGASSGICTPLYGAVR